MTESLPSGGAPHRARFVWRTDRSGRVVEISPPLWPLLRSPVHVTGRTFDAIAKEAGADGEGRLAAVLAGQATFNGLRVEWPDGRSDGRVAVEFGAMPQFDAGRGFDGFRGYAIADLPRDEALPSAAAIAEPEPPARAPPKSAVIEIRFDPDPKAKPRAVAVEPAGNGDGDRGRRGAGAGPAEATSREAQGAGPSQPAPAAQNSANPVLSASERSAFDEIARALGGDLSDAGETDGHGPTLPPQSSAAPTSNEKNLGRLVDHLPIGVLVDRDGLPLHANRTLLDLLGFGDVDEFRTWGGADRMFGGRALEGAAADTRAVTLVGREGVETPVDVRVEAIEWGGQARLISVRRAADRTAVVRARTLEQSLRESRNEARELRAILDTATDGAIVLDGDGRVLSMNRSAEALFGCEGSAVAGRLFDALVSDESRAAFAGYLAGLREGGVGSVLNEGREILCRGPRGSAIPVFVTVGRLGSDDGPRFCAVLRDLTAWKNAERTLDQARAEAERASAQKSEFLARISHEVRTPLNAILGFAEVMMDERFGPVGSERYREYLKDIHRSGEHVMSLVNDLLDLSKIEAGKMDMTFTSVDANAAVSDCMSLMQPQAGSARVVMRSSLAPRLPRIVADERAFKQILLNILSNAVKYNEPGGQVIVSTTRTEAGHAILRVRDTGPGMSESEVQIALEPFSQIATTRATTGTGLGLPLTKALVEANRASFTIRSRKGEGTLVEVAFPPSRAPAN